MFLLLTQHTCIYYGLVSQADLQAQCTNYNTRLTDAEVSYETLRNKAKLREEELLSLLEELNAKNKKPEDIGKFRL